MLPRPPVPEVAVRWLQRIKGLKNIATANPKKPYSMAASLQKWARKQPDHPALLFEDQRYTYAELNDAVARRGGTLTRLGVRRGDNVSLMMDNRPDFLIDALALNRIGAVPALINTKLQSAGLRHAILVAEPSSVIVGGEHLETFQAAFDELEEPLGLPVFLDVEPGHESTGDSTDLKELHAEDEGTAVQQWARLERVLGSDLVAFIYTSGTTGLPKAGRVLNARAAISADAFGRAVSGLLPRDVLYCCLPLFHSNGFLVATAPALDCGATLALARKFSASRFWDDIYEFQATGFVYIGEVCRYLLNTGAHPRERQHRLNFMLGNGMRPEVWKPFVERFNPGRVQEFYGATEGNVNMVNPFGVVGAVGRMPPIKALDNALLVRFDHDTQMPARDARGRCIPCEVGEVGELLGQINEKRVTQRFDGYLNPEATRKKVLRDAIEPGDAWFRTGDLLKQDKWGFYYFVDRIGDTFRWKGENVSTNEVAGAVASFPDVEIANVYGVKIPGSDGRAGMATLVLQKDRTFDPEAFYQHIERELPPFARPAFARIAEVASLTATFKLKKTQLVKEGFDLDVVTDPIFYRDDEAKTYQPLTPEVFAAIEAGENRF